MTFLDCISWMDTPHTRRKNEARDDEKGWTDSEMVKMDTRNVNAHQNDLVSIFFQRIIVERFVLHADRLFYLF